MSRLSRPIAALTACLLTLSACDASSTAPSYAAVAGTYVISTVQGPGAATGRIVLSASGIAERRVRYSVSIGGLTPEYVSRGSYQPGADGTIELRLHEDDGPSANDWLPSTRLSGNTLVLQYPSAADGNIEETYLRQ